MGVVVTRQFASELSWFIYNNRITDRTSGVSCKQLVNNSTVSNTQKTVNPSESETEQKHSLSDSEEDPEQNSRAEASWG